MITPIYILEAGVMSLSMSVADDSAHSLPATSFPITILLFLGFILSMIWTKAPMCIVESAALLLICTDTLIFPFSKSE